MAEDRVVPYPAAHLLPRQDPIGEGRHGGVVVWGRILIRREDVTKIASALGIGRRKSSE